MNKILDVVEDLKQNITDNQYKTIMDQGSHPGGGKRGPLQEKKAL